MKYPMIEEDRQLAGRVICTGIPGLRLDPTTRDALVQLRPSGIVLFRRNYESVEQLRELTAALHALPSVPLVAIDHEGGAVMRLPAPFTQFPAARSVAQTGAPEFAFAVGKAMGLELASIGIDLNFAPVLDVDSNPGNPVIGERSFGATPEAVTMFALALMNGLHAGGVISCGKHFPGHGDTDRDSHLELPVVKRPRDQLGATELPPFRAAAAAGIPVLMTAHVLYSALDEQRPATFSRRILRDLLRLELGYSGVIASDDLGMGAVSTHASVPEAAVSALQAGVDWILICNDLQQALQAADRIAVALASDALDRVHVVKATERIRRLTPSHRTPAVSLPAPEHEALNQRIRAIAARPL